MGPVAVECMRVDGIVDQRYESAVIDQSVTHCKGEPNTGTGKAEKELGGE